MNKIFYSFITITSIFLSSFTYSANVPIGTKLAKKQELVRNNGTEPASIDPQKVEGTVGGAIARDLFEGLVATDDNGSIIPGQAESWTVSEDNKVFTFKIRKDARWSNGDPVTAEDFVYSFQRAVDPKTASNYAWYMEIPTIVNASDIIKGKKPPQSLGVKALSPHLFQVTLQQSVPYFIKMAAHYTMFPTHRKTIEKYGNNWTKPGNMVSNGAYKLASWVVNDKMTLVRNSYYWDNKNTVINKVTFLPIQSATATLHRYKAGQIDITDTIPLEQYKTLKRKIPNQVKTTPQLAVYYYAMNTQVKPFDDVRVRKALSYAINRKAITTYILGQGQKPAYAFTPESVDGFTPPILPYSQMTQKQRNIKAKQWLQEAGYNKQHPLKFTLLYNTSEAHKKVAVAVAQMWKQALHVQVKLENQEWKTFLDTKNNGDFEVSRAGWVGDYNEASTMLDINTTTHGNNDSKFSNLTYDKLMHQSRIVTNNTERVAIYTQAEEILAEQMPNIPVYQYMVSRLVKPYVKGYPMNDIMNTIYTKNLYIIKH